MLNRWIGREFGYFEIKGELERLKATVFDPRGYLRAEVGEPQIEEGPEGLLITLPVSEGRRYVVGDVSTEGCTLPRVADVLDVADLKRGEVLTRLALSRNAEGLTRFYNSAGYVHAAIDVDIKWTDPPETPGEGQADLIFKVTEGVSYRDQLISSIVFQGNEQVSSDVLEHAMKYAKMGRTFNNERLMTDLDRLRVLIYADRGFIQAHLGEPNIVETGDSIKITIPVNEGRQYRLGKVTVENATLLGSEAVIELLQLKEGDLVRGKLIHDGQERLKELYNSQGYIQFNSDLDIAWNDPQDFIV